MGADQVAESVSHANGHGFSLRAINPGRYNENCAECAQPWLMHPN